LDLTPTTISIQLADYSIRQPVGILEDVPVRVDEFVIPCDFFVMDTNKSPHMPLILGRPFLATAGAEINVQAGALSFCICGERVDFCFPPPIPTPTPSLHSLQRLYLHPLQHQYLWFLLMFLLVSRSLMEMEDPIFGNPGIMV